MKTIKRALDPNNVMNPGKYLLDEAYEDGWSDDRLPARPRSGRRTPQRITDTVVMRFDHVYEVDPALMTEHVRAAGDPGLGHAADRRRRAGSTSTGCTTTSPTTVLSGEELLQEIEAEG